ncbi:hypothetical protein ACQ4M3_40400 [Leptolyngbya sp. AN03gr2]|uniref:hypothetical protein n=1 Tax=unclassified Leptolyngbya TaxID=2650499 RepID=UPI003D31C999
MSRKHGVEFYEIKLLEGLNRKVQCLTTPLQLSVKGVDGKAQFRCLFDDCPHFIKEGKRYEWETTFYSVYGKRPTGCKKCKPMRFAQSLKKSVEEYEKLREETLARNVLCLSSALEMNQGTVDTKHSFRCMTQDCPFFETNGFSYEWKTTLDAVFGKRKSGCKYCSIRKRADSDRLSEGEYVVRQKQALKRGVISLTSPLEMSKNDVNTKYRFECALVECGNTWDSTPNHIFNAETGCPSCADRIRGENNKLPVSEYEKLIEEALTRNFKCLDSAEEMRDKGTNDNTHWFQCLLPECQYKWTAAIGNVFRGKNKTGCPECGGTNKKSVNWYEQKQQEALERGILCLTDPLTMSEGTLNSEYKFQHIANGCNHIWDSKPNRVLTERMSGCPKCAPNAKKDFEWYEEQQSKALLRNIRSLSTPLEMSIGNTASKYWFQCLNECCENEWYASVECVFGSRQTGCEPCNRKEGQKAIKKTEIEYEVYQHESLSRQIRSLSTPLEMSNGRMDSEHKFECLKEGCGYQWDCTPERIFGGKKTGCPNCYQRRIWSDRYSDSPYSAIHKRCSFSVDDLKRFGRFDIKAIKSKFNQRDALSKITGETYVVDHLVPVAWIDDENIDEVRAIWKNENLRAIHWKQNQEKRDRLTDESLHEIILNQELFRIYQIASRKPLDVILRVDAYITNLVGLNDRNVFLKLYPNLAYLADEYDRMYKQFHVAA